MHDVMLINDLNLIEPGAFYTITNKCFQLIKSLDYHFSEIFKFMFVVNLRDIYFFKFISP